MTITAQDVQNCARLSRLAIDDTTAQSYASGLDKILAMMDVLDDVDTQDIAPLANIHEACTDLRADVADTNIDKDSFQKVAPNVQDGLYLVPQVIE
ncbi:Asp-tRNA(Asn)/Glu-tRNA(Gln) amidotransferase subunit GatC [Moraxella nasovis]|uniref:Asp-tRNA(Asn)/Glu-tRNA(Gln) amidotransferase subunit GatC n=1 Tax=Moraxella nasovis TaxID=2904121 RepID=UPI001F615CA6|nr:Asp-tRNA(Asn)/Glu-tRNA(Gln) amidotransferase subunit GatC [Moraxella nasovis]UNU73914.1 Asp-tRNA(Asn)/Glu-tRNA(Gln) amidotransferase subunit GatC [Moraxella nasovis]